MFTVIKKYMAFGVGLIILILALFFLSYLELITIPDNAPFEVFFIFMFWWILISLPIYRFDYLKKHKQKTFTVIGLIALFSITLLIDANMSIPDNPITLFLLLVFWLGLIYTITPKFFTKYAKPILLIYALAMVFFTFSRFVEEDINAYYEKWKALAFGFFFIPIPIFMALWIFEQWKWLQNLKIEKSKAELAMLQAQVNPHFFFNTLNNLYALAIKKSDKAPEVILKLSDMMRYTIYEGKKEMVPLDDEIQYLENFIELHKIRYKKKVDITFSHQVNLDGKIAPLLFMILLENAFKHGAETLSEEAFIEIKMIEKENDIYFTIKNNFELKLIQETSGIGLQNLQRRLHLVYDKDFDLNINTTENTYQVTLKIPVYA